MPPESLLVERRPTICGGCCGCARVNRSKCAMVGAEPGWAASPTSALRKLAFRSWQGNTPQVNLHLAVTLALAHARSDRMEWIVRQATELGVQRLVAFRSARSQYGLDGDQAEKRRERWSKIAREALCQCGRIVLPEIVFLPDVASLIESASAWLAPFKSHAGNCGVGGRRSTRVVVPAAGASAMQGGVAHHWTRGRIQRSGGGAVPASAVLYSPAGSEDFAF